MKRLIGILAAGIALFTAAYSHADTAATAANVLTSFDFNIVGVGLKASPDYQAVPKGIATQVNDTFDTGSFAVADIIAQLPQDYTVRAELSGPGFQTPVSLVTRPGVPFDIPTLAITGRYTLANIRLVDGAGNTLFGAVPQAVAIESIPVPLIASVTTRQLTAQELEERGVTFDKSNFSAYEFTAAIATSSGQVPLKLPVVVPTSAQVKQDTPDIVAPSNIAIPQPQTMSLPPDVPETAIPPNLVVQPFLMEVQETDKVDKASLPPIPGVVVIPGNIGFLHQYFSALALVTNGAPLQSGLTIRDVTATINFPPGDDMTPGTDANPGDDPLRMAKGASGFFPRTMSVMNAGPDGKAGTADDVSRMQPGESGQADFTIEGLKEGTHKVDFDITATLDGLPVGPVTLRGKATGAVLVRNPDFTVTLGHPSTVRAGEQYDLFVTITNTGKSIANLVSIGLDPRALSGAAFVDGEANTKSIDTILPGSSGTVKFRLVSQRTGAVTATAFESPDVAGRFILRTGVGENSIPLSPDSLILPYTGSLPDDLITAAVGLLGQAWSVATAPAGALPASVLPISKQTVTSRAYDLSEAGLRVLIGDSLVKAAEDLAFDFYGSDVYNRGFDSLRRTSSQGAALNGALAAVFKTELDASGPIAFQAGLADKVSYRPGHLSVVTSDAPVRLRLTDASGNRTGGLDAAENARAIPYADSFTLGETGTSRANLLVATRLDSPSYTLELSAEDAATFDLGVVAPDANGVLTQFVFSSVSLSAGGRGSATITTGSGAPALSLDDDADGVTDRTIAPSATIPVPDHAPHIVAATQLTPGFGPGGDKHGRNVAVLFSERVTQASAQSAANYGVDGNEVKQATLQPGSRMAFLLLRDGIGPFFKRSLSVQGLADAAGNSMAATETLPIRITATGPAAVVTGTVRTAKGEPVPNATVRLYQYIWYDDGFTIEQRYALFTEKQANADGSYLLEYVFQNDDPAGPFQIEVVNPATGEVGSLTTSVLYHGQRLTLDIFMKAKGSLSGFVRNEAGTPVGGATVQVITLADNRGQAMTSDATGAFSFTGLMVGAYSLTAVNQATLSQGSTMGTLPDDGSAVTQDVTIRQVADIPQGTVTGKVFGTDGVTPRSGVIVIIDAPNYHTWQRSGPDGSYSFSGVYTGAVTVTARDDASGEQNSAGGTLSDGAILALNVIMSGTGSVTGTVQRDDGKSAAGLYVVARPSQGQPRVLMTDATGSFRVDGLPVGNVGIQIIDPNDFNRTIASGTVTILSAGSTANIALFVPATALATGTIQGTAYHRDGTPWANATINRIVDPTHYYVYHADGDGKFIIPNLPLGGYQLAIVSGNEVINASTDLWFDTQVRNLELRPVGLGTVTGTTWDDAAKTMPTGADVTLNGLKPNIVGWLAYDTSSPRVVKSDPQTGRFSFTNVFQGSFTVSSANIFRPTPVSQSGTITADGQMVNVDLALKGSPPSEGGTAVNEPGSVSGLVLMPDGTAAAAGVQVTINFGGADVTVTTDDQGHFAFSPIIPAGNHVISAKDPVTTLQWQGSVSVPSGLDVPITIKLLGRGTLTVKVLNADGTIAPGADIDVRGTAYPNDAAQGISDETGEAVFVNMTEGSYAVSASGNGLLSGLSGRAQATIPGDRAAVTAQVTLAASGTVTGRFLKADGQTPVAGGQIKLMRGGQALAYTSSAADGSFGIQYVTLGDFSVEGYDPVTNRRGTGGGRINANGDVVAADVVVTPQGSVKGIVLNYGGTAPIGGAPVSISVSGVAGYSFSSVTAPDGSFFYSGVPAGRFTVDATDPASGLRGSTTGSLSYENQVVTAQVNIAPIGSISGRVLLPDGVTPVTTATVQLNGRQKQPVDPVTASFRYDNLAAGSSYTVAASQPNTRRSGSTVVTVSHDLEVANGDIVLRGVGTVSGVVFDSDGSTPLAGAKVDLSFSGATLTVYSAADGSFSFSDVPTGSFNLVASHIERTTGASQSGYLQSEGQAVTVNLVLGPVGSVKITVLLADGVTPSGGGGIRITTSTGRVLTGITDSTGQYTAMSIPTPCSVSLYVEDAAGVGIGRASGALNTNGQTLDFGTIVLDDKPIFVSSVNPASGAVNVPIDQAVRVIFSEPADPATVNSSTLYLTQGSTRIAGTLRLDADNGGATFTPASPLKGFTLYTLVVTDGIADRVGRKLAMPQSVSFTTVDNVPPVITSVTPAEGTLQVTSDAVVRVTFSESVDPTTTSGIKLIQGGTEVTTKVDLAQGGTVVVLTPLAPLSLDSTYTVVVSGVRDSVGNPIQGTVQDSFNTIDTVSPTITGLSVPANADLIKGNSVPVTARVADSDVASVDFYVNDVYRSTVKSAPFTAPVTLDAVGVTHLKAIAQDRAGNRGVAAFLDLNVAADTPPTVAFVTPLDGAAVGTGSTVTVTLLATDDLFARQITLTASGEVTTTQILTSTSGKSFSATFTLQVPADITHGGTIQLTAVAGDSGGNASTAVSRTLTVSDSIAPSPLSLSSPGLTAPYRPGDAGSATVTFSDNVGVANVTCTASGAGSGSQSFPVSPAQKQVTENFAFLVAANAASNATVTVTCTAADAAGNKTATSINFATADLTPPQVVIAAPADGTTVGTGSTITVSVQATDNVAVAEIDFAASGEVTAVQSRTVSGPGASANFTLTIPSDISQGGTILLTATARDQAGNVSQQAQRTILVKDTVSPVPVSLTSPGQTVLYRPGDTGSATFTASDNVGVTSIVCAAAGGASGSQSFYVVPAQKQATQSFSFQVAASAAPYAAMSVTCTAFDAAGNQEQKTLNLTVADTVPPTVIGSSIAQNATNVPANAKITVNFSETLAAATVSGAAVSMATSSGQAVAGSVSLATDRKGLTFTPSAPLVHDSSYVLTVSTAITDDAGNPMAAPFSLGFTTDNTPPTIASVLPAAGSRGVAVGTAVNVVFSEAVDPATAADRLLLSSASGQVAGTVALSADGKTATFKPHGLLSFNRDYLMTVKAGIADISGNAIATDYTFTFRTLSANPDLVGLWSMDGDWSDASGNGNDGTPNGGVTFGSEHIGGTMSGSFNGVDGYIGVPSSPSLTPAAAISVEAWVRPDDVTTWHQVVSKRFSDQSDPYDSFTLATSGAGTGNSWSFTVGSGTAGSGAAAVDPDVLTPNAWTHLLGTYDGTNVKLYVNGILKASTVKTGNIGYSDLPLRIGSSNATSGRYFKGLIDEVAVYSRSLRAEDALEHYNAGLTADRIPPAVPTVNSVPSTTYGDVIVLSGTKDVDSSIRVNGMQVVDHDLATTWQALYSLQPGQNTLEITSNDTAGNASDPVTVTVNVLPANQRDPDIVGLWHMDGNWLDFSGSGNGGTGKNGASFTPDNVQGGASGIFDGIDASVSTANGYLSNAANTFTVEFWAKPTATRDATSETNGGLTDVSGQRFAIAPRLFTDANAGAGVSVGTNGISVFEGATNYLASPLVYYAQLTGWNHIAVVYANRQPKLYLNGQLVRTGLASSRANVFPSANFSNTDKGLYQGMLDEVVIYKRALSADEILAHSKGTITASLTSPGQTAGYRPGDTGTATLTVTSFQGISGITCTASGAASGIWTETFTQPQTSITQDFAFTVSPEAQSRVPYAVTCTAVTASAAVGTTSLNLAVADLAAPVVTPDIPEGAGNVPATATIVVDFNEPLAPSTVNAATVTLRNSSSGASVAGSVTLSPDLQEITFTPSAALDGGTAYELRIAAAVTDRVGNPMSGDFFFHFTTQPVVAAAISGQGTADAPYVLSTGDYGALSIASSYVVADGPIVADTISLTGGSVLTHKQTTATGMEKLDLTASSVTIDATSMIDVTGKGYLGGWQGGNLTDAGRTSENRATGGSTDAAGGSYGGLGGLSAWNGTANAGYGHMQHPDEVGSGGSGSSAAPGGNGGGLVSITAGTLNLDGVIKADGGEGTPGNGHSGGGSGGGILLNVGTLGGKGTISANGGAAPFDTNSGAGGGGRIAVNFDTMLLPSDNITAVGGKSGDGSNPDRNGGAGTVYLKDNAKANADLVISNGGMDSRSNSTELKSLGRGAISILDYDHLVLLGASWTPGAFIGMKLNPNVAQQQYFLVRDNNVDAIFIDLSGGNLNSVAAVGDTFSGVFTLNSMQVLGKARVYCKEQLFIDGGLAIDNATVIANEVYAGSTSTTNGGVLSHP